MEYFSFQKAAWPRVDQVEKRNICKSDYPVIRGNVRPWGKGNNVLELTRKWERYQGK